MLVEALSFYKLLEQEIGYFFATKFMVSLAIISSSSVGMTHTVTLELGEEMIASLPLTA